MTEVVLPLLKDTASHIPNETDLMGQLLVDSGKIKASDVERIILLQRQKQLRFGEAAQALGLVSAEDVRSALARQFSYPVAHKTNTSFAPALLAAYQPAHPQVEALRGLRSELMLRYFKDPESRVLPLVGVDSGARITGLTTNLAVLFSQMGAKTLLVDGNLRAPSLHEMFSLPNHRGLSDALAGRASAAPQPCSPLGALWLLNSGTVAPNPQELLSHTRYQNLMAKLAEKFDVILVNTPPLNDNLDAQLIAARAGAVLMVAQENVTPLRLLEKACHRLGRIGVAVMGVVLSR